MHPGRLSLRDLFEIAADAYEESDPRFWSILAEAGDAACWYWVLGPERGRPRDPIAVESELQKLRRSFSSIAFPLIREVYPSLIASEIVSVQPMSLPSGLLFYMDYRYGQNPCAEIPLSEVSITGDTPSSGSGRNRG